jgi:hypothetical protein
MLISDQYRAENHRQHTQSEGYGERGYKHLDDVLHVLRRENCLSALDYGCGKGTLALHAKRVCEIPFANYDPSVPDFAAPPEPADLLVCTDVLAHIEPLCLQDVLAHMASLTLKACYLQSAIRPALRILSDGRNAHLLVKPPYFWFDTLRLHFDITELRVFPGHSIAVVGRPLGELYE